MAALPTCEGTAGRKVRTSKGRVVANGDCPDFIGVRRVQQKVNRPPLVDKGETARQELTSAMRECGSSVNPIRSKTEYAGA